MPPSPPPIHVIGGGPRRLGSRLADRPGWRARRAPRDAPGCAGTMAHRGDGLAELVCSNSLRSDDAETNAVGVIHREMRRMDSLILAAADSHQVPAGGALAVDREAFSAAVTEALADTPAGRDSSRGGDRPAAGSLGQRRRRHRTPHGTGSRRGRSRTDGRGRSRVLRRDRARGASRIDRHVQGLVPVALRQGGSGRDGGRLHQLPAESRRLRSLRRCAARRAVLPSTTPRRPISTAACRSRRWREEAATPCATGR